MKAKLILQFDGTDEKRLREVLEGRVFAQVFDQTLKHLFWWHHEADDEQAKAHLQTLRFIADEMQRHQLEIECFPVGKVATRSGNMVEKTLEDFRQVTE